MRVRVRLEEMWRWARREAPALPRAIAPAPGGLRACQCSLLKFTPFEVLEGPWCVHTYLEERGFVVSSCCLQSRLPRRSSDQVSACLHYPQTRQKSNDRLR
jgi:hypothetical protein